LPKLTRDSDAAGAAPHAQQKKNAMAVTLP
jgi:hypothetical protein